MKLKFKIQPFQTAAVAAVVDLFRGQEKRSSTFTITREEQMSLIDNGYGVGNMTEQFIESVHLVQNNMEIDGIRYMKLDGEEYYLQDIFDSEELLANLDKNVIAVKNSVYDYIVCDSSTVERPFAVALDNDPDVRMFFKIPGRFKNLYSTH